LDKFMSDYRREFTARDHERVIKMAAQGLTASEIAHSLSPARTAGSIRTFCERVGISLSLAHVRAHENADSRVHVPDEVVRDRDRRAEARAQCEGLPNHVVLGDPIPQESALHRRPAKGKPDRNGHVADGIRKFG
jgi:hypothetical protein